MASAKIRFCASRIGIAAGRLCPALPFGVPATAEVVAPGGGAPTTIPAARCRCRGLRPGLPCPYLSR